MTKYMLMICGSHAEWTALTPEEMQRETQRYIDWTQKLRRESGLVDVSQLGDLAAVVRPSGTAVASTDGPFTETKETVGGYWIVEASDATGAAEIASGCPGLEHGYYLEVYPLL